MRARRAPDPARRWACLWGPPTTTSWSPRSPPDAGGVRRALFVGRAQSFEELDRLRAKYEVRLCVVDAQADPHRVDEWARRVGDGRRGARRVPQ
jgi:hypothetical protein